MIEVLYFSDRDVRQKLFERVSAAQPLFLVTAVRAGRGLPPPPDRAPFAELERACGPYLCQLLVADEGKVEGMWRDPLGDLAEALFPKDRAAAYLAATGYLLLLGGQVQEVVKKRGSPEADAWTLQKVISTRVPQVAAPDPRRTSRSAKAHPSDPPASKPPHGRKTVAVDPYQVLGIARGSSVSAAKKRFHALVGQYHPDKVSHLGAEFRELAEERTREILSAWEIVRAELKG